MESGGLTKLLVVHITHHLVYLCRQHPNPSTNVHVHCAHAAGVAREVTKCIRQAANNGSQPC